MLLLVTIRLDNVALNDYCLNIWLIKMVYANQPAIPSGDITNIAIQIGAFKGFIPDVPFDSVANERVKQSMSRIHVDPNSGRVTDNHARSMHVIGVVNEVKVEFGH